MEVAEKVAGTRLNLSLADRPSAGSLPEKSGADRMRARRAMEASKQGRRRRPARAEVAQCAPCSKGSASEPVELGSKGATNRFREIIDQAELPRAGGWVGVQVAGRITNECSGRSAGSSGPCAAWRRSVYLRQNFNGADRR